MPQDQQDFEGHRIVVRARDDRLGSDPELLIDNEPVRLGRLPDGSYYLEKYAYDWHDNLDDLARSFIRYRTRSDEILRRGNTGPVR